MAGMATAPKVTRRTVTFDELRAQIRDFERQHPGINRDNYVDYFRDETTGELDENADFFRACRLYMALERTEGAR